jgi:HSP20 family protein
MKTKDLVKKEGAAVEQAENRPVYTPATDIYEKEDAILVRCDMPGVDEKALELALEDNVLSIKGTQVVEAPEGHEALLAEYVPGVYERSFTISREVDETGIKARLKDGVLDIELPKSEAAQPRKIEVKVEK